MLSTKSKIDGIETDLHLDCVEYQHLMFVANHVGRDLLPENASDRIKEICNRVEDYLRDNVEDAFAFVDGQ